jgi:hypothetical protein
VAAIAELDVVEVTADLPQGLVEGARGTVVAVHEDSCTVEFVGNDGYTLGLFEIAKRDLAVVQHAGYGASLGRER